MIKEMAAAFQFQRWQLCKCSVLICQDLCFWIDIVTAWQILVFYFRDRPSIARSTELIAWGEIGHIFGSQQINKNIFINIFIELLICLINV